MNKNNNYTNSDMNRSNMLLLKVVGVVSKLNYRMFFTTFFADKWSRKAMWITACGS